MNKICESRQQTGWNLSKLFIFFYQHHPLICRMMEIYRLSCGFHSPFPLSIGQCQWQWKEKMWWIQGVVRATFFYKNLKFKCLKLNKVLIKFEQKLNKVARRARAGNENLCMLAQHNLSFPYDSMRPLCYHSNSRCWGRRSEEKGNGKIYKEMKRDEKLGNKFFIRRLKARYPVGMNQLQHSWHDWYLHFFRLFLRTLKWSISTWHTPWGCLFKFFWLPSVDFSPLRTKNNT